MNSLLKSNYDLPSIKLIKVTSDGFFINENKINYSFSKKDFIKVLGNPERVEIVNGTPYFIYDKIGLNISFDSDDTFNGFGIDFEWRKMEHSPKQHFSGEVHISNFIVNPRENQKSFEASLSSNNIYFVNDKITIDIYLSFIVQPYFDYSHKNLNCIQIKKNNKVSVKSDSINFSYDLPTLLNSLEKNRCRVFIELIEEYSGNYQTENNLSTGHPVDYEFDEGGYVDFSITEGEFDVNKKTYRRDYSKIVLFELDIDLFVKKLKDFVDSSDENDLDRFMERIGLEDYSVIEEFTDSDEFESTIIEEKIIDDGGNIIVFDDYESYEGLSFKLIFDEK